MSENNDVPKPVRKSEKIFPIIDDAKSLERMIDWGYSGALVLVAFLLFDLMQSVLSGGLDFSNNDGIIGLASSGAFIALSLFWGHRVKSHQGKISAVLLLILWAVLALVIISYIFAKIWPGLIGPALLLFALYLLINGLRACLAAPKIKALPDATVFD